MKLENLSKSAALYNESETLKAMLEMIADTPSHALQFSSETSCVLRSNRRIIVSAGGFTSHFEQAIKARLKEIEKEVETL